MKPRRDEAKAMEENTNVKERKREQLEAEKA